MRKHKKWLVLCVCFLVMIVLGGCKQMGTMTIDTQLNINSNFDGYREMTTTMSTEILNHLFDGDVDKLRSTVEKYCPSDMGCSIETSGDNIKVKLVVPFATLSEYQRKVYRIFANQIDSNPDMEEPSVYYDKSNNMFKNGYVLEENFTSMDMLYWLPEAIKQEFPEFADEDLSQLLSQGSTTLVYNDESIETTSKISHTEMTSTAFKDVNVTTQLQGQGNDTVYKGTVQLVMDREDYDQLKSADINVQMENRITDYIDYRSSLSNTEKLYTYTFEAKTQEQYIRYMNHIFETDDTIFEIADENTDEDTLRAEKKINCYINGGYYVDFSQENCQMTHTIILDSNYRVESVYGEKGYLEQTDYPSSDKDELTICAIMNAPDQLMITLGVDVPVQRVEVETFIENQYHLSRQLRFYLTESNDQLVGENLTSRIKERLNNYITYEKSTVDGECAMYTITIEADCGENLARLTCGFLDGIDSSGNSIMTGGIDEQNTLKTIGFSYEDKIDFSQFLSNSEATEGIIYTLHYPDKYNAQVYYTDNYEDTSQSGNILSCTTKHKVISVMSRAEKSNFIGFVQIVLVYAALLLILISLLLSLPGFIRCIKAKKISMATMGAYTKRGKIVLTMFTSGAVIFIITMIRLIFRAY